MAESVKEEKERKVTYRDTLKSSDTEEHIDLAFYRPLGYAWACLARRLGVTPNVITIASIFLGIGAGIAFYFNELWINVIGMLLLVWANTFDSADGQLARMTKQYSRIGRILDGMAGDLWFATISVAICLRENQTSEFFMAHPWLIWVIAVVTGLCHAKQAAMADDYRQVHLYFLKGEDGSELESAEKLNEKLATLSWRHNFWQKLVLTFYTKYTVNQESMTPAMQRLRAQLRRSFPDGKVSVAFRREFRRQSLPQGRGEPGQARAYTSVRRASRVNSASAAGPNRPTSAALVSTGTPSSCICRRSLRPKAVAARTRT